MTSLKELLDAHIAGITRRAETRALRVKLRKDGWAADVAELERICDELRELTPLISVETKTTDQRFVADVCVLAYRAGLRPNAVFTSSFSFCPDRPQKVRSDSTPAKSFVALPALRSHVEKQLLRDIARAISHQGIDDLASYNRGHACGRQWATQCEPADRKRFWKSRRDLSEDDSEAVFEAVCPQPDTDGLDDEERERAYEEFWNMEPFGDPPAADYVRGFVKGALTIIEQMRTARRASNSGRVRKRE